MYENNAVEGKPKLTGYDIQKLARNYDAGASPAKAVLMVLATYANSTTFELWPAKKTVIAQANLSEKAGGRAYKKLIADKVLLDTGRRTGERGRIIVYRINVAQLAKSPIQDVTVVRNTSQYTGSNTGQYTGSNTGQYTGSNTGQYAGRTTKGTAKGTTTKKNCAFDDAQNVNEGHHDPGDMPFPKSGECNHRNAQKISNQYAQNTNKQTASTAVKPFPEIGKCKNQNREMQLPESGNANTNIGTPLPSNNTSNNTPEKNCAPDYAQFSYDDSPPAQVTREYEPASKRPRPPIHSIPRTAGSDDNQAREKLRHLFEQKRQACGLG